MDASLYQTALGCTAYLKSSLDLIDTRLHEQEIVMSIANGFHGLHDYAYATWLDHLHRLADSSNGLPTSPTDPLVRLIEDVHARLTEFTTTHGSIDPVTITGTREDGRLVAFMHLKSLHDIAQSVWHAERTAQLTQDVTGGSKPVALSRIGIEQWQTYRLT